MSLTKEEEQQLRVMREALTEYLTRREMTPAHTPEPDNLDYIVAAQLYVERRYTNQGFEFKRHKTDDVVSRMKITTGLLREVDRYIEEHSRADSCQG